MTRYLISFDEGAMDHIPREDFVELAHAAHEVIYEAQDAGVYIFGGGLLEYPDGVVVAVDGSVARATVGLPRMGGFTILDVPTREEALLWARKIAVACRCAQDLRQIMDDPRERRHPG